MLINLLKRPIPHSAMMMEVESDPESVFGTTSPPKINQFYQGPIIIPSFNKIGSLLLQQPTLTDKQTDRQTYKQNQLHNPPTIIGRGKSIKWVFVEKHF